ncbi:proline and serine-rich protein 3 [Discoglossus pictus]
MSSSIAVFSNRGDPFPAPVRSRTHYHPSQSQPLTSEQKQTVLSPARLKSIPPYLSDALSPPDLSFLGGSQTLVPGLPGSDSSGPFDESWPSTEGSSSKTPERDEAQNTGAIGHRNLPSDQDSVIGRYIERFRKGRPTSRLERSPPKQDMKDFWWLQTSPDSPDIERNQSELGTRSALGLSPQNLDRTPAHGDGSLSDSKLFSEDVDLVALQERAGKLILMSESSLSSGDPVSSDGVGSSSLSSISNPESINSRSKLYIPLQPAPVAPVQRPPNVLALPSVRPHAMLTPEEDILYQWRLRRKMEQAREGTLSLSSHGRTPSPPVRIPKQVPLVSPNDLVPSVYYGQTKVQVPSVPNPMHDQRQIAVTPHSGFPIASPTLTPQAPPIAVPPHLHLLCDILPCAQSQHSASNAAPKPESTNLGLHHPEQPPAPAPAVEESVVERERQVLSSKNPEKKDLRRPERTEDRRMKPKEKPRRLGSRTGQTEEDNLELAPPESPLHRAVGEVISERLFSPLPSPKHKLEVKKRKQATPSAKPANQLEPLELAAQLLEEAEGSDGAEFEDDPLLQVLREQREALRANLRAVDLRVKELESQSREDPSHLH